MKMKVLVLIFIAQVFLQQVFNVTIHVIQQQKLAMAQYPYN